MAPVFGGLQAMIWDQPVGPGVITREMVEANPDRPWVYPNPLIIAREMVEANPDRPWVYADLVANTVTQGDGSIEPL
jgi:hypothetical protein